MLLLSPVEKIVPRTSFSKDMIAIDRPISQCSSYMTNAFIQRNNYNLTRDDYHVLKKNMEGPVSSNQ